MIKIFSKILLQNERFHENGRPKTVNQRDELASKLILTGTNFIREFDPGSG